MKYLELQLNDNSKLTLENNPFTGKETIKINSEIVSEKYSILGSKHKFEILENNEIRHFIVDIKLTFSFVSFVNIEILKENKMFFSNSTRSKDISIAIFALIFLISASLSIAYFQDPDLHSKLIKSLFFTGVSMLFLIRYLKK